GLIRPVRHDLDLREPDVAKCGGQEVGAGPHVGPVARVGRHRRDRDPPGQKGEPLIGSGSDGFAYGVIHIRSIYAPRTPADSVDQCVAVTLLRPSGESGSMPSAIVVDTASCCPRTTSGVVASASPSPPFTGTAAAPGTLAASSGAPMPTMGAPSAAARPTVSTTSASTGPAVP